MVDHSRRQLFRGRVTAVTPQQRMPWQVDEAHFIDHCSRCEACIQACPEQIVVKGDGGFPTLDFQRGECTFCQACVSACPQPVFRPVTEPAWQQSAALKAGCLAEQGVMCRGCQDSCEPEAIVFPPRRAAISQPEIHTDLCTGCGACVSVCPSNAIAITALEQEVRDERS